MDLDQTNQAMQDVEDIYVQIKEAVLATISGIIKPIDDIVSLLSTKEISLYSNTELWDFQMKLSVEAYRLGEIKECSVLKDMCAQALYKEGLAKSFSSTTGAQETKKQQSIIDNVSKQAVSMIYTTAANILKTKCDEAHRLVNTIQNIQISRAAEAKLSSSPRSEKDRLLME